MEKKEAMKILKDFHDKSALFSVRTALHTIIPELNKSEDNMIKEELIKHLKDGVEGYMPAGDSEDYAKWLAWVEKQGDKKSFDDLTQQEAMDIAVAKCFEQDEQNPTDKVELKFKVGDEIKTANEEPLTITKIDEKGYWSENLFICGFDEECIWDLVEQNPADKIEPRFHEGEWITNGDYTWKIVEVKPLDYILQSQDGNIVDDTISHVDEQFHSFTIEDAKDGDVLASELCDSIILFRGIKDDNIDFYCDYDFSKIDIPGDRFTVNNGQHYGNVEDSKDFYPATKEQSGLLFQKMHEAGYTFDFEKKELKEIEQKSYGQRKECLDCQFNYVGECKGSCAMKRSEQKHTDMVEALRTEYEKGRADTLSEMKSSWSEEDEHLSYWTIHNLTELKNRFGENYGDSGKCIDWIKQLKQRIGG